MIYLDNSSTTRQYDQVTDLMAEIAREDFGNPSSLHRLGMNAEQRVEKARRQVANALGVDSNEIYFTSGGSESDNTALLGVAYAAKRRGKKIITTVVEHPAILETCKRLEKDGFTVVYLPVDEYCLVSVDELKKELTDDTILVSVMAVNNEVGTIQPIEDIAKAIKEYNDAHGTKILFHSDLVQAFGKMNIRTNLLDLASVSAHKIHGPKGVGAIYIRKGLNVEPFIYGGGQENHFRSGTENVAGIAGFGMAAEFADKNLKNRVKRMEAARRRLIDGIFDEIPNIKLNGVYDGAEACPSVLNISFLNTRAEVILHSLEQEGIFVSTGSACSSNHKSKNGSHVLRAMGLNDKEVEGALRFSFCEFNSEMEMDLVLDTLCEQISKFRKLGSFR